MKLSVGWLALFVTCTFAGADLASAQTRKPSKKKRSPAPSAEEAEVATREQDDSSPPPSRFFPNWQPRAFDWTLSPILASQYTQTDREGTQTTQTAFEAGLTFGLTGIPIVPRNPGLTLGAAVGRSWGSLSEKVTPPSGPSTNSSSRYTRTAGDVSARMLAGFYKHELVVGRGRLEYSKDEFLPTQSAWVTNDGGVLILPWLSEHLTWKWTKGFADDFATPFLITNDLWLHTRMQFELLSLYFDIGPGATLSEEYAETAGHNDVVARGRTDYLQMLSSFHLFWKLGASLGAKYIYNATSERIGVYATRRLPQQELGSATALVPPEDSLIAYGFFGLRRIFGGWGVGWHYNLQIYRIGGNSDGDEERIVDQGFGLSYEASF